MAKIGVGLGILGVAYWAITGLTKKAADYAKQVTFKIIGFGQPKVSRVKNSSSKYEDFL